MILLCVGLARALDAHGAPALPAQAGPYVWTWDPTLLDPGHVTVGSTVEAASSPFEEQTNDAGSTSTETLLGPFAGFTFGARVGAARWTLGGLELGVGAHAALPAFVEQDPGSGGLLSDPGGGFALGDARVDLPLTARWDGPLRLAVALVPGVNLPTGASERFLGSGAFGVRGRAALSAGAGPVGLTVDATLRSGGEPTVATAEDGPGARLAAALDVRVLPRMRVGAEAVRFPSGTGTSGMELLLGAALDVGERWSVSAAGGGALGGAPGTAAARGYARVTRTFGRAPAPTPEPVAVAETPAGRHDAVLQVRDPSGAPLDASYTLVQGSDRAAEGAGPAAQGAPTEPRTIGPDGQEILRLSPGRWTATVSLPGRTTVRFDVRVAADASGPASLVAILHPSRGEASVGIRVTDADGAPVDGAELMLDDAVHARTSTGGVVDISGLASAPMRVEALAAGLRGEGPTPADLTSGRAEVSIVLAAPPGTVRVRALDADGLAVDAQVMALGPEVRGPTALGADGTELVLLAPGTWTVAASSSLHGLQEREVTLSADDRRVPLVDFRYPPIPVGEGELCVRTADPDGAPVDGLEVVLDGATIGRTTTGGTACIAGLLVGEHEVRLQGARIRPVEPRRVVTGAGTREIVVPVQWAPGELDVEARTTAGLPIDAGIQFRRADGSAADTPPEARLGADGWGSYTLPAGEWNVVLAAPGYGAQERAMIVEPGASHLLGVRARLAREEGIGALLVEVLDPAGRVVGDADVRIDGIDRGRTSNGGRLRVGGLSLGIHRVSVSAPRIATVEQDVDVTGPDARLRFDATQWRPGTVTLRAVVPGTDSAVERPAEDAMVLLSGVELRGPLAMGPAGELQLHLSPGAWNAFASSPRHGEGERDFDAPSSTPPPQIDLPLAPLPPPAPTGPADLLVAVFDADGRPVVGARVRAGDAESVAGPDGAALFEGLTTGTLPLIVRAEGYADAEAEPLALVAGPQQRTVRLRGLPRALDVRVARRGPGDALDASVVVEGRVPMAAGRTGTDGAAQLSLLPGTWSVAVRAEGVGADVREVAVPAGTGALVVDFLLGEAQVTVAGTDISVGQPIRFATGTAILDPVSDALLREIAAQLLLHPEFARVALHGHTDNMGGAARNALLSRQRAEAVRDRLVLLGVPAERLTADGFGDTRPIADNATEAGRALNRRVEFIVERVDEPAQ